MVCSAPQAPDDAAYRGNPVKGLWRKRHIPILPRAPPPTQPLSCAAEFHAE